MNITVYSKPDCNQCVCTKAILKKHGLPFRDIDVMSDADARQDALELARRHPNSSGIMLPVVVVSDNGASQCWVGFQIDRMRALVKSAGTQ